jgi:hypothetical protein
MPNEEPGVVIPDAITAIRPLNEAIKTRRRNREGHSTYRPAGHTVTHPPTAMERVVDLVQLGPAGGTG